MADTMDRKPRTKLARKGAKNPASLPQVINILLPSSQLSIKEGNPTSRERPSLLSSLALISRVYFSLSSTFPLVLLICSAAHLSLNCLDKTKHLQGNPGCGEAPGPGVSPVHSTTVPCGLSNVGSEEH